MSNAGNGSGNGYRTGTRAPGRPVELAPLVVRSEEAGPGRDARGRPGERSARGAGRGEPRRAPGAGRRRAGVLARLSVSRRLAGLVLVLAVVWAACVGLSVQGLLAARSKAVQSNATFQAFRAERSAYEGWLVDDGQSDMYTSAAALREAAGQSILQRSWSQVVHGRRQALGSLATLARLESTASLPASFATLLARTERDAAGYDVFTQRVHADVLAGNVRGAIAEMTTGNLAISDTTQADFNALSAAIGTATANLEAAAVGDVDRSVVELAVLALIGVVLAVVGTRRAVRSITRPLGVIGATLEAFAAGDLTARAEVHATGELGAVASGLNQAIAAQAVTQEDLAERGRQDVEAAADTRAVGEVVGVLQGAATGDQAVEAALETARRVFSLAYGAFLARTGPLGRVEVAAESGGLPGDLARVAPAGVAEGAGLAGRAWRSRDVVLVEDLRTLDDDLRAQAAVRGGARSGLALPILCDGDIAGVLELFSSDALVATRSRVDSFRGLARALSSGLERISARERERAAEEELRKKVDHILGVVNAAAAGDLTVEVPVAGADPIGQVGESLARFLTDLRTRMGAIGESSQSLAGAAEQLTATAAQMSAGAEQTSAQANVVSETSEVVSGSVQSVAAAAEELIASIREIAKSAADAARVAAVAAGAAESANATVGKLGDSSARIGKVVKVITSIARQTNLLALNATIEAARAGEAGKGFAVVANEVKDLARETATATEDISARIEAIQADTAGAVAAIGRIGEIVDQINDSQDTIASAVEEQTATTNEIARSVSGAAQGAAEITENISGVAQVARATSAGAADTERAASDLAAMAAELQSLVGRFVY